MRSFLVSAAVCLVCACGGYAASLPDGGRGQINCSGGTASAAVTVLDKAHAPLEGAGVVASRIGTQEEVLLATDARGIVLVTSQTPGVVRVRAQYNDLSSPVADFTFVQGDCAISVTPPAATLQLY